MNLTATEKPKKLVPSAEEQLVRRKVMTWINACPLVPKNLQDGMVQYEQISVDSPAMTITTSQGSFITARYITGGHLAEYQFSIVYRIRPAGDVDSRLQADELLEQMAEWACMNYPDLGSGIRVTLVEPMTRSSIIAAYDSGDEDHQINMKLEYEVI